MVLLTGKNLGERQQNLNKIVAEVIANKKNLDEIKAEEESTDIDKLYKIDIASHYKNIDYILEVLKSGDSLYISRALKCLSLYEDSNSHFINVDSLHDNIFPYMSIKMKKKMLSTISMHIRNEERAATFYSYCRKNKMPCIAFKFLFFTSDDFKLNVLKNDKLLNSPLNKQELLKNFVGNSFDLATAYLLVAGHRQECVHNLRFLYVVCNEKYLDILEKYEYVQLDKSNRLKRLGIRISKDVMRKHKNRVLNNPLLYVNKLNKTMLLKYSKIEDADTYITSLMPQQVDQFWNIDFCNTFDYVLNLIPINEKFKHMKQLFGSKYPGEPFEMTKNFYKLKYYEMLSTSGRELWALRHIEGQKEILGSGKDYIWFKFVNVDKALMELKKYIMITPEKDKRSSILKTLVKSARNQEDLIKVLNYYYDRHINESEHYKDIFIDNVLEVHNVFEFNIDCWEAFNKLFYSLEIYTVGKYIGNKIFAAIAVSCHILHNKDMPQALINFVDLDINYSYFTLLFKKLNKDKAEIIFQYLLKLNVEKIQPFEQDPNNKELRKKLKRYVNNIFTLLDCFQKDEKECPEIARKFMNIDSPKAKEHKIITEKDIFRFLKKDVSLAVDVLSHFDKNIDEWPTQLNNVLKKLKVYFFNDVAQEYVKFLDCWLLKFSSDYSGHKLINAAVFGIFQLADESYKNTLVEKYHPIKPKIDHMAADRKLLYVQEAICRFVGYSRPPVPLESVLKYIKGDYVQYCLPMFNMYLVNLPLPLAIKFTEAILNAPLSVQKHGLRLAFNCFTTKDLKSLTLNVWKISKNVSLRMILYKLLFNKIKEADEYEQTEFYEVLKIFTSDLRQDDHDDIFRLLSSNGLSHKFIADYLRVSWEMVIKLPEKPINIERQRAIICCIERNINLLEKELVCNRIIEEHIIETLEKRRFKPHLMHEIEELMDAKWQLTATYIINYDNNEKLKQRLNLLTLIFKKCVDIWCEGNFTARKFYFDFVDTIKAKSFSVHYKNSWEYTVPIFQHILDILLKVLPMKEIYLTVWDLQLTIYSKTSSSDGDIILYDRGENSEHLSIEEISVKFAQQIGTFVKDLIEKKQFYAIFVPQIALLINRQVKGIQLILRHANNFELYFCEALANLGMKETYLITLIILPEVVPDEMKELHTKILKNIQTFENDEVQSFYYSKYCYTPV